MTPKFVPALRVTIPIALGLLLSPPGRCADPASTEDEVFVLPTLKVESTRELPPPESWSYARIQGFEVLSSASDRETRRLLRDFEVFQQALSVAWPVPRKPSAGSVIILCGRGNRFAQFLPAGGAKSSVPTVSLFARNREQVGIVLDLVSSVSVYDAGRLADSDSATPEFEVDAYKQLYREYVHFLISQGESRPPPWLAEGITQIVTNLEFTNSWVSFGMLDKPEVSLQPTAAATFAAMAGEPGDTDVVPLTTPVHEGTFNISLQRRALIPIDRMLAVTADDPEARSPLGNSRWAQQCYAFVHMCLYGEKRRWQQPLANFLQRTGHGQPSEAVFKDCFGMNYRQMLDHLRSYIDFTDYKFERFRLKSNSRLGVAPPDVRPATDGEVGRIKGDALRLTGHPKEALDAYKDSFIRGAREPELLADLGVEEVAAGHDDRGRAFLETAFREGDADRPSAWFELARLRYAEARAKPTGSFGHISATQVGDVLSALERAWQHQPLLPEEFGLAASLWNASETQPTPDQLHTLDAGVAKFPRYSEMVLMVAQLHLDAGDLPRSREVAEFGAANARDANLKARFNTFLSQLPPAPAKPAP